MSSGHINKLINNSLNKFVYDEKAVNRMVVVALAMLCVGLLALMGGAVLLGGSTEKALKSGAFTQLDIQVLDSNNLKIEHKGGNSISLGGNTSVCLNYNGIDYEISPDPPVVLEVGNNMKLSLPEEIELKNGDSAIITIKNERKNKIMYKRELLSGSSN